MTKRGLFGLMLFIALAANSQNHVDLKYISPLPGSIYIMPQNNVAIRYGEKFDILSIKISAIRVYNSRQEEIFGDLVLSDDEKTLIYRPFKPYPLGDKIYVEVAEGLKTVSGKFIHPVNFCFTVTPKVIDITKLACFKELIGVPEMPDHPIPPVRNKNSNNDLPENFPVIDIVQNNLPDNGQYYFFAPNNDWGSFPIDPYLIITDRAGIPVYYRKMVSSAYDLKIQPNGFLSFSSYSPFWGNIIMDSSYRVIDKYTMGNGYTYTDFHEFKILENGHAFVMTFDSQLIGMDTVVPGGDPNAVVLGWVFQELDSDKNVIFQWRNWDHYQITDADEYVDLTGSLVDCVHGNSIEIYSDSALLLSPRNLNEITKIDWNTGDIIWRLGGENNMFDFVNDPLGFSRQHDCRKISNGNITLFDNGQYHPEPMFSSVVEYELDEINMTATLVRRLQNDPDIFGMVMGNAQETPDSNIVTGWGSGALSITEFNPNGDIEFVMGFNAMNYRAYRFPWKTNYFLPQVDSLIFDEITYNDSTANTFQVYNPQSHEIQITGDSLRTWFFRVQNPYPFSIPAGNSAEISVMFKPDTIGEFRDVLTLNSDINSDTLIQRIAIQVKLAGHATPVPAVHDHLEDQIYLYPNPARDHILVHVPEFAGEADLCIFDINGRLVSRAKIHRGINKVSISVLSPGVYNLILDFKEDKNSIFKRIIKY
ncbi:MAG: aryl-sulfate sulfotransferase [Bacteroidales bacterium]|nr:aryl-sulfate sulfotransferase [Bacteroidales bacterium]